MIYVVLTLLVYRYIVGAKNTLSMEGRMGKGIRSVAVDT